MQFGIGTKGWRQITLDYNFTYICIIWIVTDIYGYDTDVAGYLCIETFAMAPATTAFIQITVTLSHTDARGLVFCFCPYLSVMNRILSKMPVFVRIVSA